MQQSIRLFAVVVFGLVLFVPAASAENWVRVIDEPDGYMIEVNTDSIRKGDDGLVYFEIDDGYGLLSSAIDCVNRIHYTVRDKQDWRAKGTPIEGTDYDAEEKVVCA